MRTRKHAATHLDRQSTLGPLIALLLMVVVPTLLVAMTRTAGTLQQALLGLVAALVLVPGVVYLYRLGNPA